MSDWTRWLGGWVARSHNCLRIFFFKRLVGCCFVILAQGNGIKRVVCWAEKHVVFPASCTRIYRGYYVAKGSRRGSSHVTWLHPIFKCHFALTAGALMGREGSRTAPGMRTGGRMVVACQTPVVILLMYSPAGLNRVKPRARWFRRPHFHPVYS